MNNKELYEEVYEINGNIQKVVLIEELSELQKEVTKDIRGQLNLKNLIEEIADVEIMLEQAKLFYKVNEEYLDVIKKSKIDRLERRLKNAKDNS